MSRSRRALVWGIPFLVWAALPFLATRHIVDLLVFAGLYAIAGALQDLVPDRMPERPPP